MTIDFRGISERDHVPIIRKDTETFLLRFIKENRLKSILEYGTAIGYSSHVFSSISPEIDVFSVERDEYAFNIALHNLEKINLAKNVCLIKGDALKKTRKISELSKEGFDLIFIDASKSHYSELFREAMKLSKKGGYIICDDIWQRGLTKMDPSDVKRKHRTSMRNMNDFISFITTSSSLETRLLDIGDGLSVSRYKG